MSTTQIVPQETEYISCKDTAKHVRVALKRDFPAVKFSVRSKTYSGGASINISWTDGPTSKTVERTTDLFEGSQFDGMIDLKTSRFHYITPDGEVGFADSPGTGSSGGSIPAACAPFPMDARRVHFMANFVFCNRHISDWETKEAEALEWIRQHCRCEGTPPHDQFGNEWVSDLARRMVYQRAEGETIETAYGRVVMRDGS